MSTPSINFRNDLETSIAWKGWSSTPYKVIITAKTGGVSGGGLAGSGERAKDEPSRLGGAQQEGGVSTPPECILDNVYRESLTVSEPIEKAIRERHPAYLEALKLLKESDNTLTYQQKGYLADLFNSYIEDMTGRVMIFKRSNTQQFRVIRAVTRFTSKSYMKHQLRLFDDQWEYSTTKFNEAVYVTLTANPQPGRSVRDINQDFKKSLQKFHSRTSMKLKRQNIEYAYIQSFEFQKNGRLHAHIVIFGIKRLEGWKDLQDYCVKIGLGKFVNIKTLRNVNGIWKDLSHSDKAVSDLGSYLKKYIKKAMTEPGMMYNYWVNDTRFYTYSRIFSTGKIKVSTDWLYLGSFNETQYKDFIIGLRGNDTSKLDHWLEDVVEIEIIGGEMPLSLIQYLRPYNDIESAVLHVKKS
jgi:hypothetical protein